jgi:ATP-dependent RNA helicase DDX49/DBP8
MTTNLGLGTLDAAQVEGLSDCIGRAIQEHLAKANIVWPWPHISSLDHPILRVEAYLEVQNGGANSPRSERIASVCAT